MEDVLLIAILAAAFALMIGLVQAISRMLERDTDRGELADKPPDTGTQGYGNLGNGVTGPMGTAGIPNGLQAQWG